MAGMHPQLVGEQLAGGVDYLVVVLDPLVWREHPEAVGLSPRG